jgi:DNA-binding NarL/FixJ family response regulator
LLGERARALVSAGRLAPGLDALLYALALVPAEAPALRVRLSTACAAVEGLLGRHVQAHARLMAALEALPDAGSVEAAALHTELAMAAWWSNDLDNASAHATLARRLATDAGDDLLASATGAVLALGEFGRGRLEAASSALATAGALLDSSDDAALAGRVDAASVLSHTAFLMEHYHDALRWAERGIAVCRRTGQGHALVALMTAQAFALALLGRLPTANDVADETLEAARLGAASFGLAWALRVRCWISGLIGELPDALRAGEEAVAHLRTIDPSQTGAGAAWMMGEVLVQAGEPRRARAIVLELGGGPELPRNNPPARCAGYEVLTQAAVAEDRPEEAAWWAARAHDAAHGLGDGLLAALALRASSTALLAAGDPLAAAAAALEATVCAERPGARIEAARSRLLAGRALRHAGEHEAAIAELEHAQAELDACGARHLRDEAAQELRRLGQRVTRAASTTSPGRSLGSLSARELEVAELVAAGYQNKQIATSLHISLNTVQSHIKRILAKLEAPNRAAVASKLERHQA